MSESVNRSREFAGGAHAAGGEIARDVAALVSATDAGLPTVADTMRLAANRASERAGSPSMAAIRFFWMRPLLSTAAAVVLGLFVVFGLPISWQETVGHDVDLTLAGPGLDGDRVGAIAHEMKSLLGAESVRVEAQASDGVVTYRLSASVAGRGGKAVTRAAEALATTLTAAGCRAETKVTPRTERVSGTVYAFAADRIIRVEMEGKSSSQIEAELRDALLAAGFRDANVSVTDEAGQTRVEIGLEADAQAGDAVESPTIVLTKGGEEVCGGGDSPDRCEVKIRKTRDESGVEKLVLDVAKADRTATVEVPNPGSMSDSDLRWEIQTQLDRAGIDLRVDVNAGKISVEPR